MGELPTESVKCLRPPLSIVSRAAQGNTNRIATSKVPCCGSRPIDLSARGTCTLPDIPLELEAFMQG